MRIKGQTTIELYNPNTRIKTVKRSENTFQSGVIAQGLRNLGKANASMLTNYNLKVEDEWRNVVGGLLLFEQNVGIGDNYMSAGNKMIGNAAVGVVNAGTPAELGSFNSIESSATASGITMVFDFLTSQANGTIRSVCLTSRMGGFIGYGNSSGVGHATPMSFTQNQDIETLTPLDTNATNKRAIAGNYVYKFSLSGTDLIVNKTHVAVTEGSIFDGLASQITIDVSNESHAYVVDNGFQATGTAGGKIYITPENASNIAPGGVYKYWEFDPATDTISEKSFTNPTANTLAPINTSFANGNLFMKVSGTDKMDVFDMSTGILKKEFVDTTDAAWDIYNMKVGELPNGLTLVPIYDNATHRLAIYDETNDTLYVTNGLKPDNPAPYTNYAYDGATNAMEWVTAGAPMACNDPLYLATINNLSGGSEVTKTAAQTMKVTYTLTPA